MDYLRSLGSVAVSTLVQKSGLNLPFALGPKVIVLDGIVNLYDGTKRDDGNPVSIFEYDFSDHSKKHVRPLAANALRKLRTTRHPDVLKFMDVVETESNMYIMTERVRPLDAVLSSWSTRHSKEREEWLLWGLHRISVALTFLNDPCSSTHGKLGINSIFISPSGEWKLGGFELLSSAKEDSANIYTVAGSYPGSSSWSPPEVKKGGWTALKEFDGAVADAYALGLLLHAVFNSDQPLPPTAIPPHPPPLPTSRGAIPPSVFAPFKALLNPNPKARLTPKAFLGIGMADTGFFSTNRLVKVCNGLENFSLASESEKNVFLRTLKESASSFPSEFTSKHVLPSLVSSLEFGGTSAEGILPLVLQFGATVPSEDYANTVLTPIIKLFASPDRGTRMALLDHLSEYADRLDKKTVSEKIFPHLSTGFSDTVALIREATTKSVILLAPKLNDRILNNDLLRHLAHMQTDSEPSIRTNTCILIGRLGPTLGYNTKRKVLVPAFVRALKDSFVHARVAGLMSFMATIDCFEPEDIATKVIPNIASSMIDKEKLVRDQAFRAVELFIKRLESHALGMPETVLAEPNNDGIPGALSREQTTLVNSATGAAGALAGWAISSLGKKLMPSDLQTSIAAGDGTSSSASVLLTSSVPSKTIPTSPPTTATLSVSSSASPSSTRPKGMQLGGSKVQQSVATLVLAEEWTEDAIHGKDANPWGTDDLIDIDADQDDWTAFETAPHVNSELKAAIPSSPGFLGVGNMNGSSSFAAELNPSNPPSRVPTPIPSPPTGRSETSTHVYGGPSKEEKAAEMARRKEERKQRIALLKEQKKIAART